MVERDRREDKQENISGLSPFKSAIFRTLWIAVLFSYVGAAMYDVGASWLMTSLAPNPLFVSLVTTATTLPIFLFALPSGILADIFDRRSILLIACAYMFTISTLLGYHYWSDYPNNTFDTYFYTRSRYDHD
jgi:MFS family permease